MKQNDLVIEGNKPMYINENLMMMMVIGMYQYLFEYLYSVIVISLIVDVI